MVKKHMRADDGMYHIKGKKYQTLIGSRPMVWHGNAYKTTGDLVKSDFLMNKHGRIVSQKKHKSAKKDKRLENCSMINSRYNKKLSCVTQSRYNIKFPHGVPA